jgi:acetolactate synthase-1/2/3 large subunit
MTTTVADVVADGLARAGTTRAFAAARVDDAAAVIAAMERRGITVVRVEGDDVGCVMAGVSGAIDAAPGVAVVGADVPATSSGLAYAFNARAPLIVIGAGAASPAVVGEAMTKADLIVTPASAAHWIAHACQLAMKEPWGPVRLDVPPAALTAATLPVATSCRPGPLPPPDPRALAAAADLLGASERTLVVTGRWCRSESDAGWTRAFAEARPAPVLATPNARGLMPDPHPLLVGVLEAGDPERALLASADLIVAVGVDPAEVPRGGWPRTAGLLELTPLSSAPVDGRLAVVGEVALIFEELAQHLRDRPSAEWDVARLHAAKQAAWAPPTGPGELAAYRLVDTARRLTPAGTVAVFDGGDPWRRAARGWRAVAPGECVVVEQTSATHGFAPIVAAAVQLACPGQRVVCFTDAETVHRAPAHLAAAGRLGMPVLTVVVGAEASSLAHSTERSGVIATSGAGFADAFERALGAGGPAAIAVGVTIQG